MVTLITLSRVIWVLVVRTPVISGDSLYQNPE